jgi:di/tricarboxylate transporter
VLTIDEAYGSISWRTVFLMASLIPLGWAVDSTGAAAWVAGNALDHLPNHTPPWLLQAAIALLTTLFAVVIGNVGSTIVMVPLAINFALAAGGNPTAFALVVALSGSSNIITVSNPVISMIGGPGAYTTRTLWTIGSPLVAAYLVVMLIGVNLMF